MKPEIQNFISEYANSTQQLSKEEWARKYKVSRETVHTWIRENRNEINKIAQDNYTESHKILLNRLRTADLVLADLLADNDPRVRLGAVKLVYDKTHPNITSSDIKLSGEVKQSNLTLAVKDIENANSTD